MNQNILQEETKRKKKHQGIYRIGQHTILSLLLPAIFPLFCPMLFSPISFSLSTKVNQTQLSKFILGE